MDTLNWNGKRFSALPIIARHRRATSRSLHCHCASSLPSASDTIDCFYKSLAAPAVPYSRQTPLQNSIFRYKKHFAFRASGNP